MALLLHHRFYAINDIDASSQALGAVTWTNEAAISIVHSTDS